MFFFCLIMPQEKFNISHYGEKVIFGRINDAWRQYKCYIKRHHFVRYSTMKEWLKNRPVHIPEDHLSNWLFIGKILRSRYKTIDWFGLLNLLTNTDNEWIMPTKIFDLGCNVEGHFCKHSINDFSILLPLILIYWCHCNCH